MSESLNCVFTFHMYDIWAHVSSWSEMQEAVLAPPCQMQQLTLLAWSYKWGTCVPLQRKAGMNLWKIRLPWKGMEETGLCGSRRNRQLSQSLGLPWAGEAGATFFFMWCSPLCPQHCVKGLQHQPWLISLVSAAATSQRSCWLTEPSAPAQGRCRSSSSSTFPWHGCWQRCDGLSLHISTCWAAI